MHVFQKVSPQKLFTHFSEGYRWICNAVVMGTEGPCTQRLLKNHAVKIQPLMCYPPVLGVCTLFNQQKPEYLHNFDLTQRLRGYHCSLLQHSEWSKALGMASGRGEPARRSAPRAWVCLGLCRAASTRGRAVHPRVLQRKNRQKALHTQLVTSQSSLRFNVKHVFSCVAGWG